MRVNSQTFKIYTEEKVYLCEVFDQREFEKSIEKYLQIHRIVGQFERLLPYSHLEYQVITNCFHSERKGNITTINFSKIPQPDQLLKIRDLDANYRVFGDDIEIMLRIDGIRWFCL